MRQLPEVTRRIFLRRSLQTLGAVAATSLLPAFGESATRTAPDRVFSEAQGKPLKVLSAQDYRILDAVADTIIPRGGSFELGARDVDLPLRVDRYLSGSDPELTAGVLGSLQFIEHQAPAGLTGGEKPFSSLPLNSRTAILQALPAGDDLAVQIYAGLKGLCAFLFYTDDASWAPIGYDGPWVQQARG